ncbi:hypothetical protein H7U32_03570 [Bifidobacterium pullorum subsp. saeculare]|uniref:Uncharacterized protein n=1 Tax=Bifidobacterium pullorum subsp. saeculare TaxID=78257 RepID=A0A938WX14_9BIFI|nr:hypothetical protein [Bifidobacterium pullorum]MBM6699416.1 hypothetical protein [Bifidobacterium pullorum subsp. saeculare]
MDRSSSMPSQFAYHQSEHRQSTYDGIPSPGDLHVYEGSLAVGFAGGAVPYHIACVFPGDSFADQCHSLALHACRIACYTADVLRGRLDPDRLRKVVTDECLDRMRLMARLLDHHMLKDKRMLDSFTRMPVVPVWLNGMLVNPTSLEMDSALTIGGVIYLSNVKLNRFGGIWKCTFADMG